MTNSLTKLIQDGNSDSFYIDLVKHELEWQLYDYGNHLTHKGRRGHAFRKDDIMIIIKFIWSLFKNKKVVGGKKVLNYVPFAFDDILESKGLVPYSMPFNARRNACVIKSFKLLYYKYKIDRILRTRSFNDIISNDIKYIKIFYNVLRDVVIANDFKALMVLTDQPFLERATIAVFNELGRKSFLFSHGLPGGYSLESDNRTSYLMVWGKTLRENYIKVGFDPKKVVVVGNPKYKKGYNIHIEWDDSRIVVVPESSIVWQQEGYGIPIVPDRARMLVYLYEVEQVLKSKGYRKAYYRTHPSINREWVNMFIDRDFYEEDYIALNESLKNATLVIGATSTVLLEYVMSSVNFIEYERPGGFKLFSPFDGSDKRIPHAETPTQLEALLNDKAIVNPDFINDYMQPFDTEALGDFFKRTIL